MKGFRPLEDRVLVRRIAAEERTPEGLIIPDTAKEKPIEGEVPAVVMRDETGRLIPLEVKVGEHVKWAGKEVVIDGEERLILKILGVIDGRGQRSAKAA